jgi:hypothetical protein
MEGMAMSAELPQIELPPPRMWGPKELARFIRVSVHWVYKRTEREADDPIPRVHGVGRLRFDTHSPAFQAWLRRQGVDEGTPDE